MTLLRDDGETLQPTSTKQSFPPFVIPLTDAAMISDNIWNLTHGTETITTYVAAHPDDAPEAISDKLFPMTKKEASKGFIGSIKTALGGKDQTRGTAHIDPTPEDLERAAQCGRFPTRPSDLFLKVAIAQGSAFQAKNLS